MDGRVQAIWLTDEGSAPMEQVERVEAVAGRGLAGDRYCRGTGYYSGFDECEVTLIEASAIETIDEEFGIDLGDGRHRRNVVTAGVSVHELLDERFRLGDAELVGTRPRPPCVHVEEVAEEDGVARALGENRGGICAHVAEGGTIEPGDGIEVLGRTDADPDELAAAIRARRE
jgi:MOSC domain-containing protein YiiM